MRHLHDNTLTREEELKTAAATLRAGAGGEGVKGSTTSTRLRGLTGWPVSCATAARPARRLSCVPHSRDAAAAAAGVMHLL